MPPIHDQFERIAIKDGMHHLQVKLVAINRMKHAVDNEPILPGHRRRQRIDVNEIVTGAQQNRQRRQALLTVNHRI